VTMRKTTHTLLVSFMILVVAAFVMPVLIVLMNSFKGQFYISNAPFAFPSKETFVGFKNYLNGIQKIDFFRSLGYSLWITIASCALIVLFTAMTAWYLQRRNTTFCKGIYYALIFSMIVPFQMVMFTMSKVANVLHLENPIGITLIYLGFGAGLSVFLYSGFLKGIPISLEEAASIDGCGPIRIFFNVIFPLLSPISITVAVLNAMWIWNDYLLPYLVIGSKYKTIPVAVQYLQGGYGSRDMGALMAMLVLSIIPIIIFYAFAQKYVISGVIAGAVKE